MFRLCFPAANWIRSMYVNSCQKLFTYMGYHANEFARATARSIERLTRPMPEGRAYCAEVVERIKRVASTIFTIPFAAVLLIPAMTCYALAACMGSGRFEHQMPAAAAPFWQERQIKVMSLNACFQDPWSPLTGGVDPPLERFVDCESRVAAVSEAVEEENPTVCLGQEFENLGAQSKCIQLLRQKGFRYFLRDLGSNDAVRNNSGLFVASKVPLQNVEFVPYPAADRAGLAKWSGQGALTFTVSVQGRDMRFINVHLNYGEGPENQNARNRQLKNHVVPLLERGNAAIFGDLNFNTAAVDRAGSGLQGLVNAIEGQITCTDAGKHALRGKSMTPNGQPCADCEERIDGLIYRPGEMEVVNVIVKPLIRGGKLVSDHFATIATLQLPDPV